MGAKRRPKSSRPPSSETRYMFGSYAPTAEGLQSRRSSRPPSQSDIVKKQSSPPPPSSRNPKIEDRLSKEMDDFHHISDRHMRKIRRMASKLSSKRVNNIIYRKFASIYDEHMVDHARAINHLIDQLVILEKVGFGKPERIIHDDLLEMSCGTGTVIRLLADALPEERRKSLRITANDISADMQVRAMEKLYGLDVNFQRHEIGKLPFAPDSFGTVVLSQTLHFLTDEEVLKQERRGGYMFMDEDRHLGAKFHALNQAFKMLKPGGNLIIFDEWPHILTNNGGPLGPKFAFMFNDNLRTIERNALHRSILSQLHGSRFVAQMKVPIDAKHSMYMIVYTKDPDKLKPQPLSDDVDWSALAQNARERVMEMFKAIDKNFRDSVRPPGKRSFVRLLSMNQGNTFVFHGKVPEQKYSCVIIPRSVRALDSMGRRNLLFSLIKSLKTGGSLVFIDEAVPMAEAYHPFPLHTFKREFMAPFSKYLVSSGVVRVPVYADSGMFGHHYRKII